MPQGHDYWERNRVCKRPLTAGETKDLLGRFGVANRYTRGSPQGGNGLHVVTASWVPGGVVRSTFAADGLAVTNVTTPVHAFVGTIDLSIVNLATGAVFVTHGYGDATPGNVPITSALSGALAGFGTQILAHRVARYAQLRADRPNALALAAQDLDLHIPLQLQHARALLADEPQCLHQGVGQI